jgi:hypothetical protein
LSRLSGGACETISAALLKADADAARSANILGAGEMRLAENTRLRVTCPHGQGWKISGWQISFKEETDRGER